MMKKITLFILMIIPFIGFSQNLISNSTFSDATGWTERTVGSGTEHISDTAYPLNTHTDDATGCYSLVGDSGFNPSIEHRIDASALTGSTYIVKAWVKGAVGDKIRFRIRNPTSFDNGDFYFIQVADTWELMEHTFTGVDPNNRMDLRVNVVQTPTAVKIDDVSVEYVVPAGNLLNVITVGNGTVTKTPEKEAYEVTDVVSLEAIPSTHWLFDSWSGDKTSTTNPESITMDADKEVTATFVIDPAFDYNFGFDTDSELEGWTMDPTMSVVSHTEGILTVSVEANQWSRLNLYDFAIPTGTYNKATIRLKSTEPTLNQISASIVDNETVSFPLTSSPDFQIVVLDLTSLTKWTGNSDNFRIRFYDVDNTEKQGRPSVGANVEVDYIEFGYDASLSVEKVNFKEDASIYLYPNPSSDIITINSSNNIEKVEVFSMLGKKAMTSKANKINISNLATGMYIAKIFQEGDVISTKRFVKQ